MSERIPVALIRQVCYPAGYRLPKLKRLDYTWVDPAKKPAPIIYTANMSVMGNLPNDEYRFFVGRKEKDQLSSSCRWCGTLLHNADFRKRHKAMGCNVKLVELYRKILLKDACVGCGCHTVKNRWGIPLCSQSCEYDWRFSSPPPFRRMLDEEMKRLSEPPRTL